MGMGSAPTWLRQVSSPPASQNHFNHCLYLILGFSVVCSQETGAGSGVVRIDPLRFLAECRTR